jgi:hypothetical protein
MLVGILGNELYKKLENTPKNGDQAKVSAGRSNLTSTVFLIFLCLYKASV